MRRHQLALSAGPSESPRRSQPCSEQDREHTWPGVPHHDAILTHDLPQLDPARGCEGYKPEKRNEDNGRDAADRRLLEKMPGPLNYTDSLTGRDTVTPDFWLSTASGCCNDGTQPARDSPPDAHTPTCAPHWADATVDAHATRGIHRDLVAHSGHPRAGTGHLRLVRCCERYRCR